MSPTYYDVLGVPADASSEQIKDAWREAAERFDPGSGAAQFRLFNQAAEVLLDPERRAAYDASLPEGSPADGTPAEAAPAESTPADSPPTEQGPQQTQPDRGWAEPPPQDDQRKPHADRTVPLVPLLVLGGVAFVAVALMLVFLFTRKLPADHAEQLSQDASAAQSTAERAAVEVLSYDYQHLDTDRDGAARFLSQSYRKQYVKTFDRLVKKPATQTHAKVTAQVKNAAVMGAPQDGRVEVLLFVDQVTHSTANNGTPSTALNRVRFEMVRSGDAWLVNQIQAY